MLYHAYVFVYMFIIEIQWHKYNIFCVSVVLYNPKVKVSS